MKRKKAIGIALVIMLLTFVIVVCVNIYKINEKFPQVEMITYEPGKWIELEPEVEILVENLSFMDDEEIRKIENINELMLYESEMKLAVLEFKIKNNSDKVYSEDIGSFSMETYGWSNIADMPFLYYLNEGDQRLNIDLQPGGEQTFKLPYLLLEVNFIEKDWSSIEDRDFWLTFKLYPQKHMIKI